MIWFMAISVGVLAVLASFASRRSVFPLNVNRVHFDERGDLDHE